MLLAGALCLAIGARGQAEGEATPPAAPTPAEPAPADATATGNPSDPPAWTDHAYALVAARLQHPDHWTTSEDDAPAVSVEASRLVIEDPHGSTRVEVHRWPRPRALDQVVTNFAARATASGWGVVASQPATVAGQPAHLWIHDLEAKGGGATVVPVRQLTCAIDNDTATYLVTFGDRRETFNRALADRLLAGFRPASKLAIEREALRAAGPPAAGPPEASAPAPTASDKPSATGTLTLAVFGCATCRTEHGATDRFCPECGAACTTWTPEPARYGCQTCDEERPREARFCTGCGQKLGPY